MNASQEILTPEEVAALLRVPQSWIYMSTTPNFLMSLLVASQSQPEVTANADFSTLDTVLGSQLTKTLTDADYTLNTGATPSEALYLAYKFSGTLTAARHVVVPANQAKLYIIMNNTNENLLITCSGSASWCVLSPQTPSTGDVYTIFYCDGTNVYKCTGM